MSQENVEVVRLALDAMAQRGLEALAEYWTDDIYYRSIPGAVDDRGPMRGKDAVRAYFQDWFDTFDELTGKPIEMIDAGEDQVVSVLQSSGAVQPRGLGAADRYGLGS